MMEEMKAKAKKIDEGINALEKKLQNPSLLGYLDDDLQDRAAAVLDELLKEMDIIDGEVSKFSEEMTEDIHDTKSNCDDLQEYIETIEQNIESMVDYGKQYGYVPPAHLIESDGSDNSDTSELSQSFETSVKLEDETPVLLVSDLSNSARSDNNYENWEQTCRPANQVMNETFTTPCSMYKVRHLNLPDISENKSLSYSGLSPAMASSSPKFLKPKFNLDETASTVSDAPFTINSSGSSMEYVNPRRLTVNPTPTNRIETPPEPQLSTHYLRLVHRSAKKQRNIN